jgi:uncharacterized membrane protein
MRRFALTAVLLLAACKPAAEATKTAATPAPAPVTANADGPFAGEFNALGTEPFWAVEIREKTLKLSGPDRADLIVPNPGPRVEGLKALWPGKGLVVVLTEGACSDGMSDRTYPYFAEVTTTDATLKGCATRPGVKA